MTNNTQLPAEVVEEIKAKALAYMHAEVKGMTADEELQPHHLKYAHEAGATEYATKLHVAQQEIESLTNQLKNHGKVADENMKLLRQENEKARTLLSKFISRHEAGLLPDQFLYNEIKQFLDGTRD